MQHRPTAPTTQAEREKLRQLTNEMRAAIAQRSCTLTLSAQTQRSGINQQARTTTTP